MAFGLYFFGTVALIFLAGWLLDDRMGRMDNRKKDVRVYRPPAAPVPVRIVRRDVRRWRAAWIAGLVCALMPLLATGAVVFGFWWIRQNPHVESEAARNVIGGVLAGAAVILLCALLLDGVAIICAVAAMILGAPGRGLLILFLTLPVFAVYALIKLSERAKEPEKQWFYYEERTTIWTR